MPGEIHTFWPQQCSLGLGQGADTVFEGLVCFMAAPWLLWPLFVRKEIKNIVYLYPYRIHTYVHLLDLDMTKKSFNKNAQIVFHCSVFVASVVKWYWAAPRAPYWYAKGCPLCVRRKAEEVHIKSVIVRSTYMHREFSKGSLNSIRFSVFHRFKILWLERSLILLMNLMRRGNHKDIRYVQTFLALEFLVNNTKSRTVYK